MLNLNFNPFPTLQTQRLVLRALDISDAPALSALRSMEVMNRYVDRAPTLSVQDAEERIIKLNSMLADGTGINWAICLPDNPTLIGTCCLFGFSAERASAELGYELHPAHQGKSLAAEAVEAVLGYAINGMGVKRLQAVIQPANIKSVALVKRFGFMPDADAKQQVNLPGFDVYTLLV